MAADAARLRSCDGEAYATGECWGGRVYTRVHIAVRRSRFTAIVCLPPHNAHTHNTKQIWPDRDSFWPSADLQSTTTSLRPTFNGTVRPPRSPTTVTVASPCNHEPSQAVRRYSLIDPHPDHPQAETKGFKSWCPSPRLARPQCV